MAMTEALVQRAEAATVLDGIGDRLSRAVGRVTHRAPLSNAVGGTWLGHPLHPVLTDLPIGFWTSAFVLDVVGRREGRRAAQLLVGLGVASAVPTAMAGLADWADTSGGTRRVGSVHAILNGLGLATFALSWRARRRGQHGLGVLWCFVGSAAATAAAALGGELVYRRGTGVDTNAFDPGPQDWARASIVAPLDGVDGVLLEADGMEVLAVERRPDAPDGSDWDAIGARCSHRGAPLQAGTFRDGCVDCPWHHSVFRLDDGSVVHGPATAPQPAFEVREMSDGRFLRRRRKAGI